ncbi:MULTISPECIES: DUF1835 domain-containing protein [unclassified Symbiopectobacterium]|uniref:DUF1835 domain-containing protein n=1 Tax=unclassified Symbiopectobacterium TaxID=2794573 RepID=UPI002227F150|nr:MULTISPECIES: DUF1835 domain-containing protein [unclassified Symbiopectobacterium]MCW2473596.1 DUF1835 domain-containing protein [Candidatus Symbiopectobacterium sp. NZEC151]MCW2484697.1 DUF1835 domain-containing protein [Candidatus Symbiopectobacterium sp. NZEC127]
MSVHPISNGHISLVQQRKRAKELLQRIKAGLEPEKLALLHRLNPTSNVTLASAQWLIARDVGFDSWPKLKAHVDAIAFARRHPHFAADDESKTQHWRCGNDIEHSLRLAGFRGTFHSYTDPLAMGPVQDIPFADYRTARCTYIQQAFQLDADDVMRRFDEEQAQWQRLPDAEHAVLWCEADPYDQLFLIRTLSTLEKQPQKLELIAVDDIPGVKRFIGLGQLSPDVLAWLWTQRQTVPADALTLARLAWSAWCAPSPVALFTLTQREHATLPYLSRSLRRLLQELPGINDGLSLTERLSLQYIAQSGPVSLRKVFRELIGQRDPLPYMGDMMFYSAIRPLILGPNPLLRINTAADTEALQTVELTPLGNDMLNGNAYWLDVAPQSRWVGGVCLTPREGHWAVDNNGRPVWRDS